jgi:hypothetical protein
MNRFHTVLAIALLIGGTVLCQPAAAQFYNPPQNGIVSPWMGLWQKNTGALDNYHTFVLPQMQLNQTLQLQSAALNRQELGLQNLNAEVAQPKWDQSRIMATGQGATFMSYSHYYYGGLRPTSRPGPPRPAATRTASHLPAPPTSPQ